MDFFFLSNAGGHFKNAYGLSNPRAFKIKLQYEIHIFEYMGMIFCMEFKRVPWKFHAKNSLLYIERRYCCLSAKVW